MFGAVLMVAGILEWVYSRPVHAFFQRRNLNKSRWRQDIRGWTLANVRVAAVLTMLVGALFVFGSLNR